MKDVNKQRERVKEGCDLNIRRDATIPEEMNKNSEIKEDELKDQQDKVQKVSR